MAIKPLRWRKPGDNGADQGFEGALTIATGIGAIAMSRTINLPFSPEDIAEGRLVTRSKWRIEKEHAEDGSFHFHIWSVEPPVWLFTIYERDHANASGIAERVVNSVNKT